MQEQPLVFGASQPFLSLPAPARSQRSGNLYRYVIVNVAVGVRV